MTKREIYDEVKKAKRNGKIAIPKRCQKCGKIKRLHGHHEDYSKPLELIFLCPKCHRQEHKGEGGRQKKYNFDALGIFEFVLLVDEKPQAASALAHAFLKRTGRKLKTITTDRGILAIRIK